MSRSLTLVIPMVMALYHPFCTTKVARTAPPVPAPVSELWQAPIDLESRDLYVGPWGAGRAPDPTATYTLVSRKQHGTNPGMTVTDPSGREWSVKQPPHTDQGAEGPIEVALSRVLSAVGYHQPPVYFARSITIKDGNRTHVEPGGRFRLSEPSLKNNGTWSWQQNPFVGMRPYQGLLVILLMFNSSDLKNENNALYEVSTDGNLRNWYVVRDLGTALGETGRFAPQRGDPDIFERTPFITSIENGLVTFEYHGWHRELFQGITPADVQWACALLSQLNDHQWADAFRAGGYSEAVAGRFIARLRQKISEGQRLTATALSGRTFFRAPFTQ